MVQLHKIPPRESAAIWVKLEGHNPGGSVKDRIALAMIEAAERDGRLKPGDVIVEPTSGNTGIGLAMVGAVKGYRVVLIMPDSASMERRKVMAAFGAELILTPAAQGIQASIERANVLVAENPDYYLPNQFANPANPEVHRRTTGPEIVQQVPGPVDAFVAGVGTGGTLTGVGEVLKASIRRFVLWPWSPRGRRFFPGASRAHTGFRGLAPAFARRC